MGLATFNRMRRLQAEQQDVVKEEQQVQQSVDEEQEGLDNSKLKVEEIKALLTEHGVEFAPSLKKPELFALLNETLAINQEKGDSE
ncbi:HeH/LEM domain-containing protein [Bisgaard Taxon 45]